MTFVWSLLAVSGSLLGWSFITSHRNLRWELRILSAMSFTVAFIEWMYIFYGVRL